MSATRNFEVHDSYVCVVPREPNPQGTPRGTCYTVSNEQMPVAEKIATALLQLKKNPTLLRSGLARAEFLSLMASCSVQAQDG
jgi:hypothetical protein